MVIATSNSTSSSSESQSVASTRPNPFQISTPLIASPPTASPPESFWQKTCQPQNNKAVFDVCASQSNHSSQNEYHLVIIGGGMSGVSAAYHAAHKFDNRTGSSKIVILEARTFCGGATGRNGGHLTPASALHYSDFAKLPQSYLLKHIDPESLSREEVYGNDRGSKSDETIRKMLTLEQRTSGELIMLIRSEETKKRKSEMKRKAMEKIHGPGKSEQVSNGNESNRIQEEVVDVDLYSGSNWYLCFSEEEEKLCDESLERAKRAGLSDLARNVKKLTKEEIDKSLSSPPNVVAAFEQPGASVHPLKLVSLIWKAAVAKAEERGISLEYFTHCPVEKVEEIEDGDYKSRIFSKVGEMKTKHLLYATNGYTSHLLPQLSRKIVPTRAQAIAAQPSSNESLPWSMGLGSNHGFEYGFQRPKNSDTLEENRGKPPLVIFGGGRWKANGMEWGISDDGQKDQEVSEFLGSYLSTQFPNSFDAAQDPVLEWSGILGYTSTSDPIVGPVVKDFSEISNPRIVGGQYLSAGFSGHGMTRCYSTSEVVVDLIVAKESGRKWKAENWFPLCYLSALPLTEGENENENEDGGWVEVLNGR